MAKLANRFQITVVDEGHGMVKSNQEDAVTPLHQSPEGLCTTQHLISGNEHLPYSLTHKTRLINGENWGAPCFLGDKTLRLVMWGIFYLGV